MTIRTLGLAILTSFSASVCAFGAVDRSLLALVPPNSQFVAGIDVVASRDSGFGQYLNTRFSTEMKGLEQFTAETGFDPRRDLQSVLVAGGSPPGSQSRNGILLARGIFDESRIRSAAIARGAVVQSLSGVDVYVTGEGLHQNAFAFLRDDVFATGPTEQLRQAVANRSAPAKLNAQLQKLISQAAANNDVWFATIAPASRLPMQFGPEANRSVADSQTLQAISAASGGVRLGSTVEITLDAVARSDKDASALVDVLRFGASLLRANGDSDAHTTALASVLNQMLVTASGPNVHLTVSMPEATLEQLAEMRPPRRRTAH